MKTTKKDFIIFKKECEKWIEIFGLKGWRVEFFHKKGKGARAQCHYHTTDRVLDFYFNTEWNSEVTDKKIRTTAFHETCEGLLCRIRVLSEYRFTTQLEIDEEIHSIIRTLENVLWKTA